MDFLIMPADCGNDGWEGEAGFNSCFLEVEMALV